MLCQRSLKPAPKVRYEGSKIVKVAGMEEHPLNKGLLCPKGEAAVEYVYSPHRLKYPMKRKDGGWERISWDEALDIIVAKLDEVKRTDGARAFAVAIGMSILLSGSATVGLIRRFCYAFGSPNCFSVESMCFRCRIISYMSTYGRFRVADPENSHCILLWAHNPVNSSPPFAKVILKAKQQGAKLIVIDPKRTPLTEEADRHLQPRPGSDCALLLGMMNVIISEGLYDKDFVNQWTFGFDKLAEHVKQYSPERVGQLTWISPADIEELARLYATTKPACIVQGTNALDQHTTGIQNGRAIAILQAITGNLDVPGGFIRGPRLRENPIEMPVKLTEKAIGQEKFPLFFGIFGHEFGEGQTMLLPDVLLSGEPYSIKAMVIAGSNPLLTWPNSQKVAQSLKKLDFLVVMDQFMSETAQLAHLVLPAATFLERSELCDYYSLWGLPYVMLRKKVIQYKECRPDLDFWFELAQRMGYGEYFPWKSIEESIDYVLAPSGLTLKYLTEEAPQGIQYTSVKYKEYEKEGFRTPSGKVEIYSNELANLGYDPMPTFRESPESPLTSQELSQDYPLILTTGARHLEFCHSQHHNIPSLCRQFPEPWAEIHPDSARQCGITDGEMVFIETRRGKIELKAKVTKDIVPGVVTIPHGWAQANANILTDEKSADQITGYPAFKALLCRIGKAG